MKKRTEKQPVDDLFARRLKTMSLPPNPDGFAKLQARMGQCEPETRVIFWRNSTMQQYVAIAACLSVVCLFGWLYLSTETPVSEGVTVATNKQAMSTGERHSHERLNPKPQIGSGAIGVNSGQKIVDRIDPGVTNRSLAQRTKPILNQRIDNNEQLARTNRTADIVKTSRVIPTEEMADPPEQAAKSVTNTPTSGPAPETQIATNVDRPTPIAERVLVVTIAEPEALLAARQAVKQSTEGKEIIAVTDKSDKDSKATILWQQVKRIKQGEVFARKDAVEDDRGLLGRAYSGLRQTFDKDKSAKQ